MSKYTNEYEHSVGASLDYSFNWNQWLEAGEVIVSSTWVGEAGITLSNNQNVAGITSTFVSGGSAGELYKIVNTIVTSVEGRSDSRTITLSCKQR